MKKESRSKIEEEVDPTGRYLKRELIGTREFCNIYKAYDRDEGMEVAWNQVSLADLGNNRNAKLYDEIKILMALKHPNIINIIRYWDDPGQGRLIFITELTSGTLKNFIAKSKVLKMRIIRRWLNQILQGLCFLHSQIPPIIHRDLKCESIFVISNTGEVKIGNLGLSFDHSTDKFKEKFIGVPAFLAPEVYSGRSSAKVDIYAFGMCILEIVTGRYPYAGETDVEKKIMQGVKPQLLETLRESHEYLYTFVSQCLQPEESRPSAQELLQHPVLQLPDWDDKEFHPTPLPQSYNNRLEQTQSYMRSLSPSSSITNLASYSSNLGNTAGVSNTGTTPRLKQDGTDMHFNDVEGVVVYTPEELTDKDEDSEEEEEVVVGNSQEMKTRAAFVNQEDAEVSSPQTSKPEVEVKLFLKLRGVYKEIKFNFHVGEDTPDMVSDELVREIGISARYRKDISENIGSAVTHLLRPGDVQEQ